MHALCVFCVYSGDAFMLSIQAMHSCYLFTRFTQAIYSGYSFRLYIQAMHSGYSFTLFIQASFSFKLFIAVIDSGYTFKLSKLSIPAIRSSSAFRLCIQNIHRGMEQAAKPSVKKKTLENMPKDAMSSRHVHVGALS